MHKHSIAIIVIIASVISCVRYLNIIQLSNFYFNPIRKNIIDISRVEINSTISYIISIITIF